MWNAEPFLNAEAAYRRERIASELADSASRRRRRPHAPRRLVRLPHLRARAA
jgi:hypothetical protein